MTQINLTIQEAAQLAYESCYGLEEVIDSFLEAINQLDYIPDQQYALAETQVATLDSIMHNTCPAIISRIQAGEFAKLGDLQRLVQNATMATQDIAHELNQWFDLPPVIQYLVSNNFTVEGTALENFTIKAASAGALLAAVFVGLYLIKD